MSLPGSFREIEPGVWRAKPESVTLESVQDFFIRALRRCPKDPIYEQLLGEITFKIAERDGVSQEQKDAQMRNDQY